MFEDKSVKLELLRLWATYKNKYGIKIFDFVIMENHAHLLILTESAEALGHFMRTVNSQLARFINKHLNRDSQAIRERYKSPLISNDRYLLTVMSYIWLNRYRVNKTRPERDIYCSASWRLNSQIIDALTQDEEVRALFSTLLDSYEELPIKFQKSIPSVIMDMINEAISKSCQSLVVLCENAHTIADEAAVRYRGQVLSAFRREHVPWEPVS